MRLLKEEQIAIKKAFKEVFKDGSIYLFGSRVDDNKKGGDIDLFIIPPKNLKNQLEKKVKFLVKLDEYIGEQKVDVIIANNTNNYFEKEALQKGIKL